MELDPNDATAHQWYGENLGYIGGREQESLAEVNRAHQLDPLSPIIIVVAGYVHNFARQYDEAIAVCKKLANENPTFARAHHCLAFGYWGKRMYPQVIEGRPMASFPVTETNLNSLLPWSKDFVQRAGRALSPKALRPGRHSARLDTSLRARLLSFMLTWDTKIRLSGGSTPLIRSTIGG